ncbi:AzlC family ABC transporter permease [Micromonospora craniellae]|uniref:Branched-chain amino acid ABC transporter permease n=1 Tax=Micromonospora craniellae TaxID=2294034 RepID=A0A372FZM8_9ACTN|nr:AzlC family ABC transporter permease [Micromonospora craniellae]QOC90978.1 AzlC family ABC transporter permease [Micromonospora craniellae]RFS45949.1 branched-chain amino acid ABC transporter permease [Micromonospora craniellae]
MRTPERTPEAGVLRDVAAIGAAMVAVGVSFGAVAVAAGIPGWAAVTMSVVVYAGGAQFMAVGLLAAGSPVAAVLAGLLLNARHLPFGLTLGETIGRRLRDRLLGSHLMTDEATAFTLARPPGADRRRAFWLAGVLLFLAWNVGTVLGVLVGGVAGDPAALGLDAAFPAGLIALLLPSLRDPETRRVALAGAVVAVLTTPLLPAGLPVLLALAGPGLLAVQRIRARSAPAGTPEAAAHGGTLKTSAPGGLPQIVAPGSGPVPVDVHDVPRADAPGTGPVPAGRGEKEPC